MLRFEDTNKEKTLHEHFPLINLIMFDEDMSTNKAIDSGVFWLNMHDFWFQQDGATAHTAHTSVSENIAKKICICFNNDGKHLKNIIIKK